MNWFAVAVIVLQLLAAVDYFRKSLFADAGVWFLYACINLILVFGKDVADECSK
jgi:hypothetical protein